ncbi:MAG: glutamine synthetase beta-grasp domain-containing protein [Acidobacteriota bacterium]|nr:glutamine synthetase beta-grasp domain-containing protein [Acidobacteriota bacterium]
MSYQAEYIWIDGSEPTRKLRSKTKIVEDGKKPPLWGFDGSSTNQATGDKSDCVLQPVFSCPDPLRGPKDVLVMCEVLNADMTPHATNTRALAVAAAKRYASFEPMFGIEQEYTLFKDERPYGWPAVGFPAPQGPYYCGVGGSKMPGREIVEEHVVACLKAGLAIEGTNAEVMMGQWEFQVGVLGAVEIGDQLWTARWLLERIAEEFDVEVSFDAKPVKGDWNGAGAHTNFSTKQMRAAGGYAAIVAGCEALSKKVTEHIANYGAGIEERLTGAHETAPYHTFSYGVSNRGASVRIPAHVARDKRGYLEDRRPNANVDPYVVSRLMVETICGAAAKPAAKPAAKRVAAKKVTAAKTARKAPARAARR